tara:strand:+ start:321428 stop:322285 length:858 start_codon:yes stop_codon:yes gene_type:complete
MRIDAHQHFWQLKNSFCNWPTPAEAAIYSDFGPDDFAPLLRRHQVEASVLVQAAPALDETKYLLGLADQHDFIGAVVGWVDMESRSATRQIRELARHERFRGIRPMLPSISDPNWILDHAFDDVFHVLEQQGLSFDALVTPVHLEAIRVLAERHPGLTIIIDHGAKPAIRDGHSAPDGLHGWALRMSLFAGLPQVSCKLSGLLTEAAPAATLSDLRPYLDHLYDVFGPERLLWGSDWPVLGLAAEYGHWVDMVGEWLSDKPTAAQAQIWGGNARRIYRIDTKGDA